MVRVVVFLMDLDFILLDNADDLNKSKIGIYHRFATNKDYLLWQRIKNAPMFHVNDHPELILDPKPVPVDFSLMTMGESKPKEIILDEYGNKLTYVYNSELLALRPLDLRKDTQVLLKSLDYFSHSLPLILYWW